MLFASSPKMTLTPCPRATGLNGAEQREDCFRGPLSQSVLGCLRRSRDPHVWMRLQLCGSYHKCGYPWHAATCGEGYKAWTWAWRGSARPGTGGSGSRPSYAVSASCHRLPNFNLVYPHSLLGAGFPRTVCNKARAYLDSPAPGSSSLALVLDIPSTPGPGPGT